MLDKVTGRRWANDSDLYLIELFKALNSGWVPPENVSPEMYRAIRLDKTAFPAPLVAFVGFQCTFGGKWFGGYANGKGKRNYAREGRDNLLKQLPKLEGVTFTNLSYSEMDIQEPSIIYCDPPYANTVSYGKNHFEHAPFWQWVRDKSKEGHTVFVSEYQAPDDFECIKEVRTLTTMNRSAKDVRVERLFVYAG